jgi:hypothetical protein
MSIGAKIRINQWWNEPNPDFAGPRLHECSRPLPRLAHVTGNPSEHEGINFRRVADSCPLRWRKKQTRAQAHKDGRSLYRRNQYP